MKNKKSEKSMKILLATDGSAHSKVTVERIAGRLFPPKTKVRIVAAYERVSQIESIESIGIAQKYYAEAAQHALKSAENAAKNAAKILHKKKPGLIITTAVVEGSPKNVILEEAEKFKADLIVVGSHGNGGIERFLLGSVSQAVSLHAKCSVEIVRR